MDVKQEILNKQTNYSTCTSLFQFASLGSLVSFIVTCAKHPVMTNLSFDGCTVKSQDVSSGRLGPYQEKSLVFHM